MPDGDLEISDFCSTMCFISFDKPRTGIYFRFAVGTPEDCDIPEPTFSHLAAKNLKEVYAMGYGRHTKEESTYKKTF